MQCNPPLLEARFLKRYKRFFVDVELPDGATLTIHCPNTGSMKNCLAEGQPCWYSLSDNPKRKLPGTLEITTSPQGAKVGVNTHRANSLVEEAVNNGTIAELQGYQTLRREVKYGEENSRIDLLLENPVSGQVPQQCFVEVKNMTLADEMKSTLIRFPDAVTSRGSKHLRELIAMKQQGHRAVLLFCVQHSQAESVAPAWHIDPAYCQTLAEAINTGVEVLAYGCRLNAEEIALSEKLPFHLMQP